MKIKIIYSLVITAVCGAIYGSYDAFLSEPKPQPQQKLTPVVKVAAEVVSDFQPLAAQKTNTASEKFVAHLEINDTDEASIYTKLNQTLMTLAPNQIIQMTDLKRIANCPSCLRLLQNTLLTGNLSKQQLMQLANSLAKSNQPKLATLLVDSIAKMAQQTGGIENDSPLINALANFNSPEIAKEFVSYVAREQEIPAQLQTALMQNINETSSRSQVASEIVHQFNATSDATARNQLLAINQPEALATLHAQALTQGDTQLVKQTSDLLSSNPSKYAIDAVLSLLQTQMAASNPTNEVMDVAYQLANHQFSGNRLDYIENKLSKNFYPEEEKQVVLDILKHSEDAQRASEIIAKFSSQQS